MKKLLVLTLVLAVTSMASAGIVYRVGGTEYAPDASTAAEVIATGTVVIELYNQTQTATAPTFAAVSDVGGYISTGDATGMKITSVVLNTTNLPGTWSTSDTYYSTYTYGVYELLYDEPTSEPTLAGTLVTITMTGVAEGDTLVMMDGSWANMDAGLTFVPEPTTMALLGLGSLFLARRKK